MTLEPKSIDKEEPLGKAQFLMENLKIQFLFVVDKSSQRSNRPIGFINFHDIFNSI